ncbi:MAG: glycosyltransferase family 4 protein [bacterium]|nr:glycosyltransferase family 4 protein [bacterium]
MKLCVLGDASYPHARNWVNYFKSRGAEVYLISLQNSIGTSVVEHTIPSKQLPGFLKYPLSIGKIASLIKSINPDIVNAHFVPNYGFISAIIGTRPLVVSCFGSDVLEPPRKGILRKARIKFTLNKADLVTTDGKILKDAVHKFGIPYSRILNIPIGIDTPVFNPLKKTFPPKVVYMRRLEYVCNPELFVNALPAVISQCNIKPVMLDMGSHRDKIFSLVKKLGLESKIEFMPFLSEQKLASLLGESTIYVSTSFSDSTSVTLLEAMSCGAFPVVTDIIGNREWVKDGVNGYLVPLNNPAKLAEKIIKALSTPLLIEKAFLKNTEIIKKYGDRYKNMGVVESAFFNIMNKYKNK